MLRGVQADTLHDSAQNLYANATWAGHYCQPHQLYAIKMCNAINNTSDLGYRHNNPVEFNPAESRLIVYKAIKAD
jgi:hypothetical protein